MGDDGPAMQRIVKEYNAQSDYKVVFQPMNGGDLTNEDLPVMQTAREHPRHHHRRPVPDRRSASQGLLDTMDDWQKVAPGPQGEQPAPPLGRASPSMARPTAFRCICTQMAIYCNKDLVKKYKLQYILDDGIRHHRRDQGPQRQATQRAPYALTYGNLPWAFMSCCTARAARFSRTYGRPDQDVWRKPMEAQGSVRRRCDRPMDVDGEQAFGSGKAVFAQLGTWAQGNMSNTLGADKIAGQHPAGTAPTIR